MVTLAPRNTITQKPDTLFLTRDTLETALITYAKEQEGPIAQEFILLLITAGETLEALNKVASSMMYNQSNLTDNHSCLIWSAWMNYQEYGSPGFSLTKSNPGD